MIHASLWSNEEFSKLSHEAKLLYIGTITFADDDGRLKGSSAILRSQIFPLQIEITVEQVRKWLNEIVRAKLVTHYKVEDKYYIQHPNWLKYQILRKDRKSDSNLPAPDDNQMTTNWQPDDGISKEVSKRSKKGILRADTSLKYFSKIPEKDLMEFLQRFDCSKSALLSKIEDLKLYCQKNGKFYRNYKAFILAALKKDFPPRRKLPTPMKEEEVIPINPDLKKRIDEIVGKKRMPS